VITWRQFERGLCLLLGTVHFLLGFVTWVGGEERFPAPGYTPLLQLSNGVVWPYGIAWMIGGAIMILCRSDFRLVGIGIVILVSNLWAALFMLAAFNDPHAPLTPMVAYGGYGLMNAVLAAIIWMHRGQEDGKV
jgi:uncharacterized membrane protein